MPRSPRLDTRALERRMGNWGRSHLSSGLLELGLFVLKQGWACLFGGLLLLAILVTKWVWSPSWPVCRYDALFLFAVLTQIVFLTFRLETWKEAQIILLFHVTGTMMEWFKVSVAAWTYPEPGVFKIMHVPLFSGFMYAAVGSYMVRVIRIFDMRFTPYPPFPATLGLSAAIYLNFFTHHALPDMRWLLFLATVLVFGRTRISFRVSTRRWWMPLPCAAFLSSLALWIAENIGTFTGTWLYSKQHAGHMVRYGKIGSWYLLLYVAFVTTTIAIRPNRLSRSNSQSTT
ncbi:DUF817 domain-containing protein [Gluconacetobacter asukensis]|nr:DUF817 domain-containing protein [Gluconacetobacter asukensis]